MRALPPIVRRARRVALAIVPVMLLSLPAFAQASVTVSGTVVDQQSQQPVAGAVLTIPGSGIRTTSDDGGRFTLAAERDFATIVVTRIGYAKKQVAVADKNLPLVIELVRAAMPLSGLEVTGRSLPKDQLTNAQSVGTLTTQDLQRGNGLSLENSLNTLPGVLMQSRTPWGGAHITIRGYYPNFSQNSNGFGYQLFLNDIPVTDATGFTVMDDIDYSALGSVEVVKGPASSRYGGAIAGAVSLRTATPAPQQTSIAQDGAGGSDGLFRTNTTFATATDRSGIVVNYGHQTYDGFRPNSTSKKDFARFTGDFKSGDDHVISTYFSYNNSFEQLSGEIDENDFYNRLAIDNPVYALNHSHIAIESSRAGVTDRYRINRTFDNQATVFATEQLMSQPFAHGFTDTNRFSFGARNALEVATRVSGLKLDGVVGGSFQKTNYTANGFSLNSGNPSDQENYAMNYYGFSEWNATLPAEVVVTAGVTISKNEFGIRNMLKNKMVNDTTTVLRRSFDAKLTPRASVLKAFGDAASVYASVSTGYTPPALSSIINSDNTINTALKPESAVQYEVGSKGRVLGHRLSYDLALFDLENTDKLVSQKIGAVTSTTNVGKQRNRGAEVTFSYLVMDDPHETISLIRPWVTYTYSHFTYLSFKSDNNNNAATVDFSGRDVARVPRSVFNAGFDASTKFGLYLYGSYQFVDKMYATFDNATSLRPYNLVDAKAGYQRRLCDHFGLDVSAGGDNLLGSTYYTYLFVGPNFKGLAQSKDGGTGDGFILPGSYNPTFYGGAKLTYTF
jgi:iron complex outermembrane receptor protein